MAFTTLHLVAYLLSFNTCIDAQPLDNRDTTSLSSSCNATQTGVATHFGSFDNPWRYAIAIYNENTPERGSSGQGLLDNIKAECHNDPSLLHVEPLEHDPQTNALTAYNMTFSLPASLPDTDCVQTAIQKAEGKDLSCERQRPHPQNQTEDQVWG